MIALIEAGWVLVDGRAIRGIDERCVVFQEPRRCFGATSPGRRPGSPACLLARSLSGPLAQDSG
ncbi:hypothetical protein [Nonomuraea jiangxiensis]|uniref:Uncharacterized protein n=1 Tax=Nonomuraea jiangxiensis TaxID=633440 RepID=A0A1G8RQD9_9ACTN|nr:hypothetical protein [Nonomuraea jiangxiensis]SDJ19156.1 hypothetical protein SAMN05421869_109149 [Nonomuraea jiangxiensis]